MTNPIQGLPQPNVDFGSTVAKEQQGGSDFLETLRGAVDQVKDLQSQADTHVAGMLNGDGQDVHSAMIAVEKANLAFELMLQVRNKIVSAYQEVSRIPF
ncbi:MAG TPA: flagellar hook-basal body complex protein FliE [Candidatus Acidoferrales bacterium]|nr:flagellar hook-basal body complex protein FliE [Candidatus Acidoferrales bacterium]